ncbi:MAG TPA: type II secretion system protein N [Sphingomonas sp.]|jgi:general secretion pathway protein N
MRRLRLTTGPWALFGAFLLAALLLFLPMRLVLGAVGVDDLGLSARRVGGSIWSGSLSEARVGALPLGDLRAHLSPWPLFLGRARIELDGAGTLPGRALRGAVTMTRHGVAIDELTAGLAAGILFQPLPVSAIDLDGVSVRFADGACVEATGRVRATLGPGPAGLPLPPSLAGSIRCEGTSLLIPLTGQAGAEGITLRVEADGRYRAEFALPVADPALGQRLGTLGFIDTNGAWRLTAEGRF